MEIYQRIKSAFDSYKGKKQIIGRTEGGRELFAFFAGNAGGVTGICQYAIHAREWVTALLALEHISYGLSLGGVWFLPLMNPDGAELCLSGLSSVKDVKKREFLRRINGGTDFSLWKANANGVDLNVNFDAGWGRGEKNLYQPAGENYVGESPFSERETQALRDFTRAVNPDFTISYHTAGEEIYYRYKQSPLQAARDQKLAKILARSTGYALGDAGKSHGGYKDWCILKQKIPAFTIEAGKGRQPLGLSALRDIVGKNLHTVRALIDGWNYAGYENKIYEGGDPSGKEGGA